MKLWQNIGYFVKYYRIQNCIKSEYYVKKRYQCMWMWSTFGTLFRFRNSWITPTNSSKPIIFDYFLVHPFSSANVNISEIASISTNSNSGCLKYDVRKIIIIMIKQVRRAQ